MSKVKFDDLSRDAQWILCDVIAQSDNWTKVTNVQPGKPIDVKMVFNGVEFDFQEFTREYMKRMRTYENQRAAELLDEKLFEIMKPLTELDEEFKSIRGQIRVVVCKKFGIDPDSIKEDIY